jgi:ribosomal protein S18 acetylase RimI-like enzyme
MPTPFPLQRLDSRDVGQMIALYERINWRIHIDYLHWMLDWSEGGAFGITYRNKLLATAIGLPYSDQRGWLAMVVTDPSFQRRGLGQRITQTALDFLVKRGLSEVMLDASPMGLPLYEHMGFSALYPMITYRGLPALDESPPADERIRQATDADLPAMIALDGQGFGAQRPAIIKKLFGKKDHQCWVDEIDGDVKGFLLVQHMHKGEAAFGPWIHSDADGARRLFIHAAAQAGTSEHIRVNVPEGNTTAQTILNDLDMPIMGRNTRMIYGDVEPLGEVGCYHGAASAALG